MDFVAIDFETANEQPSSACQLGVVVVEKSEVVFKREWWIRPQPFRFSPRNIEVHGIRPERVLGEATFCELWDEVWEVLQGRILIAHNARFDIGVLRACLQFSDSAIPDLEYSCTRALARQAWPGLPSYGLRFLADFQGIQFRHHDALEDAEACASLVTAIAAEQRVGRFRELEKRLGLTRGRAGAWGNGGPRLSSSRSPRLSLAKTWKGSAGRWSADPKRPRLYQERLRFDSGATLPTSFARQTENRPIATGHFQFKPQEPQAESPQVKSDTERFREIARERLAFQGATVVFTGNLQSLDREDAESLVQLAGGNCASSVTRKTQVLVVGQPDTRTLRAGRTQSTKETRAMALIEAGQAIEILSEEEFYRRLVGSDGTAS